MSNKIIRIQRQKIPYFQLYTTLTGMPELKTIYLFIFNYIYFGVNGKTKFVYHEETLSVQLRKTNIVLVLYLKENIVI
jgi:hypothetical protein